MLYTIENYKKLAERFNSQSFTQKIITIKNNQELLYIQTDGYNIRLRINDEDAMNNSVDTLFEFPQFLDYEHLKAIFSLIDLSIKELK